MQAQDRLAGHAALGLQRLSILQVAFQGLFHVLERRENEAGVLEFVGRAGHT